MTTWEGQNLVFVNDHAKSSEDLFAYRDKAIKSVKDKFGIELQQEPETI